MKQFIKQMEVCVAGGFFNVEVTESGDSRDTNRGEKRSGEQDK